MTMLVDCFSTFTPCVRTSCGSIGIAMFTRFCVRTAARSGSVPIAKVTVRSSAPRSELDDVMYSMFSTPLTCCSIGAVTVSSSTEAFAPGKLVVTFTVGGVMSGIDATGSSGIEIAPASTMTMETTIAMIGRFTKREENAPIVSCSRRRRRDRRRRRVHLRRRGLPR